MDRDELIAVIVAAFESVDPPSEITLHVAEAHAAYDYDHDEEHREKDWIGGWQAVPDAHLMACEHALDQVDIVGVRYYLPAYMVWYLRNYGNRHDTWIESARYPLGLQPPGEVLSSTQLARYSLFTDEQMRACRLFGELRGELNRKELIRVIEEAFDGVEGPELLTLHVAEAHDSYDYDHDEQHRAFDHYDCWQGIPDKDMLECPHALSYVDKVGMRFYLPAFMTFFLRHFGENIAEWWDPNQALYALNHHPYDDLLAKYHKERFSLFSSEQFRACALFVRFCAEDDTGFAAEWFAREHYENYWKQYDRLPDDDVAG